MSIGRGENGSVALYALIVVVCASAFFVFTIDLINFGTKNVIAEETLMEGEALAQDILEFGKYLMLYERVIYVDDKGPLDQTGNRGKGLMDLWKEGFGIGGSASLSLMQVCGGYDAKGRRLGDYEVGGARVFCPLLLRNHVMDSLMLESMMLEPMAEAGVIERTQVGNYFFNIDFFDAAKGIDNLGDPARTFFRYNIGQRIIAKGAIDLDKVSLETRIFTSSSGLDAATAERFIQLTSMVTLANKGRPIRPIVHRTNLSVHASTPRDFAFFVPYPTMADGTTPTRRWSEAIQLPRGSRIKGRVLFNGDINVPLQDLPDFDEVVILTGDFVPPVSLAQLPLFRSKFKKGVLTRFSGARFLFTGNCSTTDATTTVVNHSGLLCETDAGTPYTINQYLLNIPNECTFAPVTGSEGKSTVDCSKALSSCPTSCPSQTVIHGPLQSVRLTGTFNFIAAPVAVLTISTPNVYGTVFGGHITATTPVVWKSFSAIKPGDIGVGSIDVLDSYMKEASKAYEGITAPLTNLPIVASSAAGGS